MEHVTNAVMWFYYLNPMYQVSILLALAVFYSYFREAERVPQDKLVVVFYLVVIGIYTLIAAGILFISNLIFS